MFPKPAQRAFTLIEVMIVVLIVGILLAIAVPNYVRIRESSRQKTCVSHLKNIQSAIEQWAMDNRKGQNAAVDVRGIVRDYLRIDPDCPAGGIYLVNRVSDAPRCTYVNSTFPHAINALNR